jgi:hypothetical protein
LRLYFLLNRLSLLAFLVFKILSEQRVNSGSTAAITAGGGFLVPDRPPAAGPIAASATNEQPMPFRALGHRAMCIVVPVDGR